MTYLRHDLRSLRDYHDLRIDRSILWIHRTSYLLMTYLRHDLLYYLLNLISLTCNELFSLRGHHDVGINRSVHPLYPPHLRSTASDEFSHLPVLIATSLWSCCFFKEFLVLFIACQLWRSHSNTYYLGCLLAFEQLTNTWLVRPPFITLEHLGGFVRKRKVLYKNECHSLKRRCHSFSKSSILPVICAIYLACVYWFFNKFLKLKKNGVFSLTFALYIVIFEIKW